MLPPQTAKGTPISGAAALVTGANRGFGLAMVNALLARGATTVYAASRSPAHAVDTRVTPILMNVVDDESVRSAAEQIGNLSILVNNAGIALNTAILTADLSDMRSELEVNLFGIIRVARAFAPALAANPPSSLLNVLSVMSWLSTGRGYEISKAAAWSATNALRLALRGQGTAVTALHVSYMDTDMTTRLTIAKSDPALIARQACDAIEQGVPEALADDHTRLIKQLLSGDLVNIYPVLSDL